MVIFLLAPVLGAADAERVLTQLTRSGHKVIVATSNGYAVSWRVEVA